MLQFLLSLLIIFSTHFFTLSEYNTPKNRKRFLFFCGIGIILLYTNHTVVAMFSDSGMYYNNYIFTANQSYESMLATNERDRGYFIMVWLMTRLTSSPSLLFYAERAMLIFTAFAFINRYSDRLFIPVIYMFASGIFTFYMSAFRQCFAFCFCLLSYLLVETALQRHSNLNFLLGVGMYSLSLSMHASAIVFLVPLLMLLLGKGRNKLKGILLFLFLIIVIIYRDRIIDESEYFIGKNYNIGSGVALLGGIIQVVVFVFPPIMFYLTKKNENRKKAFSDERMDRMDNLMNMLWLGIVFYMLRFSTQAYERIAVYFTVAGAPLYGNLIDTLEDKDKKVISYVITTLFLALFFYRTALKT